VLETSAKLPQPPTNVTHDILCSKLEIPKDIDAGEDAFINQIRSMNSSKLDS
jgi:hypothetical protein